MEEKKALLSYVPQGMLFVETDAPYLAPVPMRGKANNPTYIEWTYKFIAQARGMEEAALCETVDQNARRFFRLA